MPAVDDISALGADSTTVPRAPSGTFSHAPTFKEPHVHVQAVIKADLGARWIGFLRASAPAVNPLKWHNVQGFVLEGQGFEARIVRDGLGEQTIVITDPMDMIREVDLNLCESGRVPVPICALTMGTSRSSELARTLHRFVSMSLLQQSGVGTVESLISNADDWLIGMRMDSRLPYSVERMMERCGGNLRRIAKLASQSTALIIEQHDPDAMEKLSEQWAEAADRFNYGTTAFAARRLLRQIGRTNIIFDRDEQPITAMVEQTRLAAELTASYDWLGDDYRPEGWVRTGMDENHIRLQLADVAAGWAKTLVPAEGYLGVAKRFRLVLYNGQRLTLDDAARLDRLRAAHRHLLGRVPPSVVA